MNMATKEVYQIAGVQMPVVFADPEQNAANVIEHLHTTAAGGADLTIFPECVLSGYCFPDAESARAAAVDTDSLEIHRLLECVRDLKTSVILGFLERTEQMLCNTVALLGPVGWVTSYRKVHLPKLGVDRFTKPGVVPFKVVEHQGLRIGMLICYDCSFPEAARVLALQGADLIALPTNWPVTSGCTADFVPNCRALENNVYFAAIDRVGEENGFKFIGKSKICAPTGRELAFANHDRFEILSAEIRPAISRQKHLVHVPGQHEVHRFADRRPYFYGRVAETASAAQGTHH
jgi:predicted amidohydrolase